MCRGSAATLFNLFLSLSPSSSLSFAPSLTRAQKQLGTPPLRANQTRSVCVCVHVFLVCPLTGAPPLLLSVCAAINILGLTWQLKPSEGPVLNKGLGAVNSDVATLPSGGRGRKRRTAGLTRPNSTPLNQLKEGGKKLEFEANTSLFHPFAPPWQLPK